MENTIQIFEAESKSNAEQSDQGRIHPLGFETLDQPFGVPCKSG